MASTSAANSSTVDLTATLALLTQQVTTLTQKLDAHIEKCQQSDPPPPLHFDSSYEPENMANNTFAHLPPEVLLIILRNVPDLPSLYRFICASAQANAVFKIDAPHILDKVIKRSIPDFQPLARMISLLGSLDIRIGFNSRRLSETVTKYGALPKDLLTKAAPSLSFITGTSGPRYVLLTAYRIEHLRHVCFTTLLQNIHELIFVSPVDGRNFSDVHTLKQFRPGVFFKPVAWWSPSWVERFRIERALWRLFMYWNIEAVHSKATVQDPDLRQYNKRIRQLSGSIIAEEQEDAKIISHRVEEMNCISAAVYEFLGCEPVKFFTAISSQGRKALVTKARSKFALNFKETASWKFEDPKPSEDTPSYYWGQAASWTKKPNSEYRDVYWSVWERESRLPSFSILDLERRDLWFSDYLGLCLWDYKRLLYLGLDYGKYWDPSLGRPAQPDGKFFSSDRLDGRWRDVILRELVRLPGHGQRMLSLNCKSHIGRWDNELRRRPLLDGWRLKESYSHMYNHGMK
ncbi:hypothetical protein DTO169E5_6543 [Paecilomyces variotii]|nr:hypothetical protein DTO169E5_6543 [Paecilomyces variotii]